MWKKKLKMGKAEYRRLRWSQNIGRETCYKQDIPNGMLIKIAANQYIMLHGSTLFIENQPQATGSIGAS
jgi:hypothetical protein